MTIASEESSVEYIGNGVLIEYPYGYRADADNDIFVFLDGIRQSAGYVLTRGPNSIGGLVAFDTPPGILTIVVIRRILDITQNIDYTPYDAFPAETHERGLDKLTMIAQQQGIDSKQAIKIPDSEDPASVNTIVPLARDRADKFLYFDNEGNATVVEADPDIPSVFRVDVQDGSAGEDSRSLLQVETVSGGASYPKIGFRNINKPNGPVQLTENGTIPPGLINITGIQVRGPFRGDDLCDKPGDDPGACIAPDTRNPSERFPGVVDALSSGDAFIITMADGEVSGTMSLFANVGDATPSIVPVAQRDGIIFLRELADPDSGDIIIYEGWYLYPQLAEVGDASFISYTDTGNEYVLGSNVQVALDATDGHFQDMDEWFGAQRSPLREGFPATDANAIYAGGVFQFEAGSGHLPSNQAFMLIQAIKDGDNLTQMAMEISSGTIFNRGRQGGVWSAWVASGIPSGSVMLFYQAEAPAGWTKIATLDDHMVRVVSGAGGGSGGADSPIAHTHQGGSHSLTENEMPSHTHGMGHSYQPAPGGVGLTVPHTSGKGIQTRETGGDQAHSHGATSPSDLKHINCILCRKD